MNKLYRVTSNGQGIFQVIKESMSQERWHDFLDSKISTWLPNPGEELYESNNCITFFTEEGYYLFLDKVMPLIYQFIPTVITVIPDTNENLLYSDRYQKVFRRKQENENEKEI